jgi:hypothetical protein
MRLPSIVNQKSHLTDQGSASCGFVAQTIFLVVSITCTQAIAIATIGIFVIYAFSFGKNGLSE